MFQSTSDIEEDDIDLGDLIAVLVESRWLIVAVTCVALLIGAYKAFTAVQIYRADGLLHLEDKQSGLANLASAVMQDNYTLINTEIEILRSRSVLGTVVDNLQLDIYADPEYAPYLGEALARRLPVDERPMIKVDTLDVPESMRETYLKLVADGAGGYSLYDTADSLLLHGQVDKVAKLDLPDGETLTLFVSQLQGEKDQVFWIHRGSRLNSTRSLQGRLDAYEQGEYSGILVLSVEGTDPESITEQVNEIANVYVRQNVERKSAEAEKTLDFLDGQLPLVRQNVEIAELALNNYRLEKGSINLPAETQDVLDSIVTTETRINNLLQDREKIRLAFTDIHPKMVTVDRQIGRLNDELSELNTKVRELPTTQQELLRLIRDAEVNTALYTSLLHTAQELRVVKAGTVGNARVIDYAVKPTSPIRPNRSRTIMLHFILGVFASVALAFGRKMLKSGIDDPDKIERHINIPIYATISHSRRQDRIFKDLKSGKAKSAILAIDTPNDPAIESLRNLLMSLHFGMMDVKNNCILIAGPSPSVGKTFVSVNLATVLTSTEKKVLLIDADLRRGHLHKYLGVERENGLSEFISGAIPIGEAMHETPIPGLTLIPTGTLPPNPTEMLLHQRFRNLLSVLGPRYDHVLVDSPPILAAADATIIGQMVGGTLMVLKAGAHPMREIEQAAKRLNQADVNLRGILFNDVHSNSRIYGAGKYHYQYSYKNS